MIKASRKGSLCILTGEREHAELLQGLLAIQSGCPFTPCTEQEALTAISSPVQEE